MSQIRSQTSSCSPSQSHEDPSAPLKVWTDVVGGKKKGRLYDAGDIASNYKKRTSCLNIRSLSSSGDSRRSIMDKQKLVEVKRRLAEVKRRMTALVEEKIRMNALLARVLKRQEQMYEMLVCQQPQLHHQPPPPPHGTDDVAHCFHGNMVEKL